MWIAYLPNTGEVMNAIDRYFLIAIAITTFVILIIGGCTTLNHEPYCKCNCKGQIFECGGFIEHRKVDIK
jgi:hypothetical protein